MPGTVRTPIEISLDPTSSTGDIITSDGSSRKALGYTISSSVITDYSTGLRVLTAQSSASLGLQWNYPDNTNMVDYELISSTTTTTSVSSISMANIISNYKTGITNFQLYNKFANYRITLSAESAASNISNIRIGLGTATSQAYYGIYLAQSSTTNRGINSGDQSGWTVLDESNNQFLTTDGPIALDAWIINYGTGTEYSVGIYAQVSSKRHIATFLGNLAGNSNGINTEILNKIMYTNNPVISFGAGSIASGATINIWGVGKAYRSIA